MRKRYFVLPIRRFKFPAFGVFDRMTGNRVSLSTTRAAADDVATQWNRDIGDA